MTESVKRPGLFRQLQRRKTRGLALFDVILAVGILGILIAGGVVLLQSVNERIARNATLSLVNQIRSEVSRIYAGRSNMNGLTIIGLWNRGSLPDETYRGTNTGKLNDNPNQRALLRHSYDGPVNVWPMNNSKRFIIGLADLDDSACSDILGPWAGKSRSRSGILSGGVAKNTDGGIKNATAIKSDGKITAGGSDVGAKSPFKASGNNSVDAWCTGDDKGNDIYIAFQG